jgi:hypothetical protein
MLAAKPACLPSSTQQLTPSSNSEKRFKIMAMTTSQANIICSLNSVYLGNENIQQSQVIPQLPRTVKVGSSAEKLPF